MEKGDSGAVQQLRLVEWWSNPRGYFDIFVFLLKAFDANDIPKLVIETSETFMYQGIVDEKAAFLTEIVDGLDRLKDYPMDNSSAFMLILQERIYDIFKWLELFFRKSRLVFRRSPLLPALFGTTLASTFLLSLWDSPFKMVDLDDDTILTISNLVVDIWVQDEHETITMNRWTPDNYVGMYFSPLSAMTSSLCREPIRGILQRNINALPPRSLSRLANRIVTHLKRWEAAHEFQFSTSSISFQSKLLFMKLVWITRELATIAPCRKALQNVNVWSLIPMIALKLGPFQYRVAVEIFPPLGDDDGTVLAQLLKGGILEMISRRLTSSPRLFEADAQLIYKTGGVPDPERLLERLSAACVHPKAFPFVRDAIIRLPDQVRKALCSGAAAQAWGMFRVATLTPSNAYDQLDWKQNELCDNLFVSPLSQRKDVFLAELIEPGLQHPRSNATPTDTEPSRKICSWCKTAIYCSEECQKRDWKEFHKDECAAQRVARIGASVHALISPPKTHPLFPLLDWELKGAWVSPNTRLKLISLLDTAIHMKGYFNTCRLDRRPSTPLNPIAKNFYRVIFLNFARSGVVHYDLISVDSMMRLSHGGGKPVFQDQRSLTVLADFLRNEQTQLFAATVAWGKYMVITLGRYHYDISETSSDGKPKQRFSLLDSTVKVLDGFEPDGVELPPGWGEVLAKYE